MVNKAIKFPTVSIIAISMVLITVIIFTTYLSFNKVNAQFSSLLDRRHGVMVADAPIVTSGNNVCIAWWTNKSGNNEVMFRASHDGGKTFGPKINLSNTKTSDSEDVQIAAEGNNVYVTWWERNQTFNEPFLRVSNDNGFSFGPSIMLSSDSIDNGLLYIPPPNT